MTRLAPSLAAVAAVLLLAAPALAADYNDGFTSDDDSLRSGFSDDWSDTNQTEPLSFELGTRYWYSWGVQNFNVGAGTLNDNDNAQTGEAFFRIDDSST